MEEKPGADRKCGAHNQRAQPATFDFRAQAHAIRDSPCRNPVGVDSFCSYTQGSSCLATLTCCLDMIFLTPFMLKPFFGPSVSQGCSLACRSTKASAASRSGTAGQGAGFRMAASQDRWPANLYLIAAWPWTFCSSCRGKKMRPTLLCKGGPVACASSFNPRMAFGQSVAQPEPRMPCAPNSNRCQSAGYHRQLVYVRMSPNTIKPMQSITVTVYAGVDVAKASLQLHLQGRQAGFANQPAGLIQLCQQLKTVPNVHVVCEATGGYERLLVQALHQAHIPVSVTNPAHVRAAAQAPGKRAKQDRKSVV